MVRRAVAVLVLVGGVWGIATYSMSRDGAPATASAPDAPEAEATTVAERSASAPSTPLSNARELAKAETEESEEEPVLIAQREKKPAPRRQRPWT